LTGLFRLSSLEREPGHQEGGEGELLSVILEISLPVFALILCGYLAGRTGILGEQSAAALNGFVFYFALPALLFGFTAQAPLDRILNWPFISAVLLASIGTYVIALVIGWGVFGQRLPVVALAALTGVFANTGYLGIPLFLTAFGQDMAGPAIVATVSVNTVFVGGTIAFLEFSSSGGAGALPTARKITLALVKNPLVSAPIIALPFTFFAIDIPSPAVRFLDLLGSAAGPAALFAIGLSFVGRTVEAKPSELGMLIIIKMIVHPFLTWLLVTYVFEMSNFWASSAVLLAALPTAAVAFVMAQERKVYVTETSSVIVASTLLSVISISALLILLQF